MDAKKVQEVIDIYRKKLLELGIQPIDFLHEATLPVSDYRGLSLGHCLGMLPKMEEFLKENRMDKVFRWLGFIQGVLWTKSVYSLEELKDHNRP